MLEVINQQNMKSYTATGIKLTVGYPLN